MNPNRSKIDFRYGNSFASPFCGTGRCQIAWVHRIAQMEQRSTYTLKEDRKISLDRSRQHHKFLVFGGVKTVQRPSSRGFNVSTGHQGDLCRLMHLR